MTTARELITKIGFQVDDSELKRVNKGVERFSQRLHSLGDTAVRVGGRLTTFVTAPLVGLTGWFIKTASDAEETASKFGAVFDEISDQAEATAKNIADSYGLSAQAAKNFLSNTGDQLVAFKFNQQDALELSKQITGLAVDLVSFKNFSGGAEGAAQALTKALMGERESIKSLGLVVREEDVKLKVLEMRKKGLTFATENQARAQATFDIILDQSTNSIGDYERTQMFLANSVRRLGSRFENLRAELGKKFLPLATDLVHRLEAAIEWFRGLDESTKDTIITIVGLTAVIGPLILGLGILIKTIAFAATGLAILFSPVTLAIAGAAITILSIGLFIKKHYQAIAESVVKFLHGIVVVVNFLGKLAKGILMLPLTILREVKNLVGKVVNFVRENSDDLLGAFLGLAMDMLKSFASFIVSIFFSPMSAIGKVVEFFGAAVNKIKSMLGFETEDVNQNVKVKREETQTKNFEVSENGFATVADKFRNFDRRVNGLRSDVTLAARPLIESMQVPVRAANDSVQRVQPIMAQASNPMSSVNQVVSPPTASSNISNTTSNRNSQTNINYKNDVVVNVPPGTSEQQAEFLKRAADESFKNNFDRQVGRLLYQNSELE